MRFDMICEANDIAHPLTKPNHPWTDGQVTPYEYIKVWTSGRDRFILGPIHQMPELNT